MSDPDLLTDQQTYSSEQTWKREELVSNKDPNGNRPVLLGHLKALASGAHCISSGEGEVRALKPKELRCLRAMDGFRPWEEIAAVAALPLAEVHTIFERYRCSTSVDLVSSWNKLRWCADCLTYQNAHSLDSNCVCGGSLHYVDLDPPFDPWICFGPERELITRFIEETLGHSIPPAKMILGNNCLRDGAFHWQVIIDGDVAVRVHFKGSDPESWRFSATEHLARVDWRSQPSSALDAEIARTVKANADHLEDLVRDTEVFVEDMSGRWPCTPLVYFSGGKESVVMADIFSKLGLSANLVFGAVGFDFPEDIEFMRSLEDYYAGDAHLTLHRRMADASEAQAQIRKNGPITLRDPWCRLIKYANRDRLISELYPPPTRFIAFEGSRCYENDFRRSNPRVELMRIPGYSRAHYWARPLAYWNGLDIWTYIYSRSLPVNPLYHLGFQRTTCWLCPIVNPFHLHRSKVLHPGLWEDYDPVVVPLSKDTQGLPF